MSEKYEYGNSSGCLRVIDNHVVVLNSSALVFLCDPAEGVEEETVTELHDVGLVDASNFLQNVFNSPKQTEAIESDIPCGRSSRQSRKQSG